jgi:RNA-directed DNA polymerase
MWSGNEASEGPPGNHHHRRPGSPGVLETGAGADLSADFLPCSYGFRPKRRTHDAVAEVRFLTSRSFQWVVEGDIKACLNPRAFS